MLKYIFHIRKELFFLGLLSLLCFSFSLYRVSITHSKMFLFLNWNLFLAFIPWGLSHLVLWKTNLQQRKYVLGLLLFTWLLFFPNAPYILTDLYHLKKQLDMPIWFDLLLILSFSFTGLLFGLISLKNIEKLFRAKIKTKWLVLLSSSLLFISSFGIYLGRYLRWNSWDILKQPLHLLQDIGNSLWQPGQHPDAWGMTLFMGIFLNMMYWASSILQKSNVEIEK